MSGKGAARSIADIKMPVKSNGKIDKRYSQPQIVKADGTRDKRCTPMRDR